jgi:hypothetical protein
MRLPIALLLLSSLATVHAGEFRRFSDGHKLSVYARPVAARHYNPSPIGAA